MPKNSRVHVPCLSCGAPVYRQLPLPRRVTCLACEMTAPVEKLAERVVDYRLRIVGAMGLIEMGEPQAALAVLSGQTWPTLPLVDPGEVQP